MSLGTESIVSIIERGWVVFDFSEEVGGAREHDPIFISLANYIMLRADMMARSFPHCNDLRFLFLADEAHRIKPVQILDTIAKEGRAFGIALVLGSQQAKDFREDVLSIVPAAFLFTIDADDARAILSHFVSKKDLEELADYVAAQPRFHCLYIRKRKATKVRVGITSRARSSDVSAAST